jgi:hypothetical protein
MNNTAKDLTQEAPRSARTRIGGYAILGRTIDKCRALLWSNIGDYHFDCPLDNMLFGFKGVAAEDFKKQVESGAGDEAMVKWLNDNGTPKTPDEVKQWSDGVEAANPFENPERRDWFVEQTKPLGLDPAKTTLFDWLDADDKASYAKAA